MLQSKGLFLFLLFFCPLFVLAQEGTFLSVISTDTNITYKKIDNPNFKEYYEVLVKQPNNHLNPDGKLFEQKLIVGINDVKAPVVFYTEGYALGEITKPTFIENCNVIYAEHRFFGQSLPKGLEPDKLTIKQAAYDLHHVREIFRRVFSGKWMASGASKSGQTALAYKMYFPQDVDATLVYGTPVRTGENDPRIPEYLKSLLKTDCGKKVKAFQDRALKNCNAMLPEFDYYAKEKKYTFNRIGTKKALEYMILEYSFSFFQNGNDCSKIPDSTASAQQLLTELIHVVPARFYSDKFYLKLKPSFYMFYHELGYYEYDLSSFKGQLSQKSYPNNVFAPTIKYTFDGTYLRDLNKFIADPKTEKIIFIYGENDPYSGAQPTPGNNSCLKLMVKNGNHKSRVEDLNTKQQEEVFKKLSDWLQYKVGS